MHEKPASVSSLAATEESTPPDMATNTFSVSIGSRRRLHGSNRLFHEFVERPAEHVRAALDDLARAAGGKFLILELFLEGLELQILHTLRRQHPHDGADEARELVRGVEDLLHLVLGLHVDGQQIAVTHDRVDQALVDAYEHGVTPNPCIDCNRYLKFDKLFERADILGCRYIATGHYARVERAGEKYVLKKALDETKDQSYVLYDLTQEKLARVKFPLGTFRKTDAREMAAEAGLCNARKHDSQDICFVPDGDYAKIIAARTGKEPQPGPFLDLNGNVVGTHRGIIHYTVGQRRGLRMPSDGKIYVVRILPEQNAVVVGPDSALYTNECFVANMHWISGEAPAFPYRCSAKTRYRQPERPCTVYPAGQSGVRLVFDEPLRAITPGQSAVLYDGDTVLGGGIIAREAAEC